MSELLEAIKRLATVSRRIRAPLRGRDWTAREHDAQIIETEILPVLERMANASLEPSILIRCSASSTEGR